VSAAEAPRSRPGREILFEDLFNVRDLGGYPAADGRVIRDGWWFRGASLHRVSGTDVRTLRGLRLRTAIDLRTAQEIKDHGAFPAASTRISVRHLPLIPRTWERRDDLEDLDAATRYLTERFVDMLETGAAAIADTVRTLSDPRDGPVIVYCMAGKDRTGVLTAIVMDLLGVSDEEIARDFHRSHEAAQRLFAWSEASPEGDATMLRQSAAVAAAPPAAILDFLSEARRRYGSIGDYVAGHGIDEPTLRALRSVLLID
jgi:protein-tyrosine phosphatase